MSLVANMFLMMNIMKNNDKPIYINTEGKVKTNIWSRMSKTEYWRMKYRYMMNRPVRSAILVVAIVMALLYLF